MIALADSGLGWFSGIGNPPALLSPKLIDRPAAIHPTDAVPAPDRYGQGGRDPGLHTGTAASPASYPGRGQSAGSVGRRARSARYICLTRWLLCPGGNP